LFYQKDNEFISYISTHSFEDFAGTRTASTFIQGLSKKTIDILHIAIGPIVKYIVKYIEDKELNPDTELRKLFSGKIKKLLENSITYFLN
jgi:hypothetical protein